jgi:integrase
MSGLGDPLKYRVSATRASAQARRNVEREAFAMGKGTGRAKNAEVRGREHLEEEEVNAMIKAAAAVGRNGKRDACMILIAYRHGLRVSELIALRWDQINLDHGTIYVKRLKGSIHGTHDLGKKEKAALRKLGANRRGVVFRSSLGGAMTRDTFNKIIKRAGEKAGLEFQVHPHMLRHACGYYLTGKGKQTRIIQDWLGHTNIANTVRYTALCAERFRKEKMWEDD